MVLRCIAVDDEPLALALVCSFIEQTPFLQLIGRFDNAIDALKSVHDQAPDLVFLDIQMSDLTGIELARILDGDASGHRTRIIFTTAYNQFALESYKVDALDYLLKPFNYEEFLRAASKGRHYFELLKKGPEPQVHDPGYIFLKVEYQLVKVAFDDIRYIEGLK
ncbi:MAG: response regulator, partial [Cyclobacteriaceae bacterium]|nr:response regulator [Cyclobacteriaceae bacterium]